MTGRTDHHATPRARRPIDAARRSSRLGEGARDARDARTAVLMLNMGGPETLDDVAPFLSALFADPDLIRLPGQGLLGPLIARLRTPSVRRSYAQMGGGSPILRHSRQQARGLEQRLDALCPKHAPHAARVVFRYAPPRVDVVVDELFGAESAIERVVVFSQYPQFSCATTGSSLHDLWRATDTMGLDVTRPGPRWSVVDRWFDHPAYIDAIAASVRDGLARFPADTRDDVVVVFSAHSLPMRIIERGDPYPHEIASTVHSVVETLGLTQRFVVAWQSAVGPVRWLGPSTEAVLGQLAERGERSVLVAPVGFTCDHIETLYELDILARDHALDAGIERFERAPSLNAEPVFLDALAQVVAEHLEGGAPCSTRLRTRCPGCPGDCDRRAPRFEASTPTSTAQRAA